jgi:hypothetical protein
MPSRRKMVANRRNMAFAGHKHQFRIELCELCAASILEERKKKRFNKPFL